MSGDHDNTTNYARLNGLIPFDKADYIGGFINLDTNERVFRSYGGDDLPVTATNQEIGNITEAIRAWVTRDAWSRIYDEDAEYDIIACWKYLGLNPLDSALGAEDPFAEGFDDALG